MRLEKGYRGWGSDLTTERTPIESGLGYLVKQPGRAFVGEQALTKGTADHMAWEMVLLSLDAGPVDPFYSHPVIYQGEPVGLVTSGAYGHRTGQVLALAYLRKSGLRNGLSVDILGQSRAATVLERPPFDPDNLRLKA